MSMVNPTYKYKSLTGSLSFWFLGESFSYWTALHLLQRNTWALNFWQEIYWPESHSCDQSKVLLPSLPRSFGGGDICNPSFHRSYETAYIQSGAWWEESVGTMESTSPEFKSCLCYLQLSNPNQVNRNHSEPQLPAVKCSYWLPLVSFFQC